MSKFTNAEKLAELERELAMRKRTYPGLIGRGVLTLRQASNQMDILREIASDYRSQNADQRSLTFPDGSPLGPADESNNMNSS